MPDTIEIEIPDYAAEYLEPIPGASPTGIDTVNDPDFFKLQGELGRKTPDYKSWMELTDTFLKEKSKDLFAVSWLIFPLYRTEGIKGLKKGLNIVLHFLKKYGNDLYPSNIKNKVKAIQFIASKRVTELLEKEKIDKSNLEELKEAGKILNEIENECAKLFTENPPALKPLSEVFQKLIEDASAETKPPERIIPSAPVVKPEQPKPPVQAAAPVAPSPQVVISSEKDAVAQLRKTILYFFEFDEEGTKKQRVPENYFVFGLSRQIQWNTLNRPPDTDGSTLIEAPNKIIQGLIKDWFAKNNYDILISRVESEFIKENSELRYWLDAQRYIVKSLQQKGGNCIHAANDVKLQLAKLISRIPDLPQLKFKDKQTPFADEETLSWLNEDVKNILSSSSPGGSAKIPAIISEGFEHIYKDFEAVSKDPAENFEKNLSKMQTDLNNEEHKKGKFLRRLNIANYLLMHKEYNLARINLLELKEVITANNLAGWENALCVSVWQSLYLTNQELLLHTKNDNLKNILEKEQEDLYYEIAKYDGIMALNLTKTKKTWR